jgi:hypothetical protein
MTGPTFHDPQSAGCFICRPEDPEFSDVEGCQACEADFGEYVRELIDAGVISDV